MNPHLLDTNLIMLAAGAILIVVLLAWMYVRKRRNTTANLRRKFGPEYDRAVREHGSERKGEANLGDRERRVETLNLRALDPMEQERFVKRWDSVQARFIDSPKGALSEADDLVTSLMKARGYPVSDFDQRVADVSVGHPRVIEDYRSAHEIALRVGKDEASTEDLRTAMIHYRSLFEELVQAPVIVETKEVA
jgi:LPXTG-motif cell wall-anchored protein